MSRHKITAERSGHDNGMDWEAEYVIAFDYLPGESSTHYQPGYPAEVSFVSVDPKIGVLDHGAFTDLAQQSLDDWARDWLDENYEAALDIVADAMESDRRDAAEMRRAER